MKLGRNLARTFLDYYKLQNFIVFKPSNVPKNNDFSNSTSLIKSRKLSQTNSKINSISTPNSLNQFENNENKLNGVETIFSLDDG